jgi:rare lipoprotein A
MRPSCPVIAAKLIGWSAAVLIAVALTGCGTFSGSSRGGVARGDVSAPARGGGYYLDDGPGANPPADLDHIPDAVPRIETLHRGTMRPYSVMGQNFTPMTELSPYRARGVATWYGRRYHGKPTASGEPYDMYAMTAAHTVLPIPSYARVTNVANGRSVIVRINDRGPFIGERLIDLSYVAAHKLDIVRNGSATVDVESILPGAETVRPAAARAAADRVLVNAEDPPARTLPSPSSPATATRSHYLQLGAFSLRDNAERFLERVRVDFPSLDGALAISATDNLFRVLAGPYASRNEAVQAAQRIGQTTGIAPIVTGVR